MIAAGKFKNLVPAGIAAGKADGTHGSLGAGTDHPDHFDGRDRIDDHLCENGFLFGWRAKARAAVGSRLHGGNDFWMAVAEYHGPPGADVIYVLIPVDIVDFAAGSP